MPFLLEYLPLLNGCAGRILCRTNNDKNQVNENTDTENATGKEVDDTHNNFALIELVYSKEAKEEAKQKVYQSGLAGHKNFPFHYV